MEAGGQTKVEVEDATLETIDMVNQPCLEVVHELIDQYKTVF